MTAQEQRDLCPTKIGQAYITGRVTFILGDHIGWDIWTKDDLGKEQIHRVDRK